MQSSKPTGDEIIRLTSKCEQIYGKTQELFRQDEEFYELLFKDRLKIPKEYKAESIVLPTARDMVDTFIDHIDIAHARVFANKKSIYKTSKEEAEMMRKFYLGLIHRTNVEADISPWRVCAKHYGAHGLGVFKTIWDVDAWADKPEREDGESDEHYAGRLDEWRAETNLNIPILIQAINPACVYPDPYYGGRLYIIERHKQLLYDAKKMYPHFTNPKNKKIDAEGEGGEVDFISYWDKFYRCDLIDGEPVLKIKGGIVEHKYGFIPYTLIESGLGNLSIDAKPEMKYVGIIRYIFDLLVSESRNYSINDVVLKMNAFPWGIIKGKDAKAVGHIKRSFGTYTPLPEGIELEDRTSPVPPEALKDHLAMTSYFISAHAAPNSVRGLPEQGVRSGADRRLMIAEASSRYSYAVEAFRHGTEQVLIKCAKLLKNVIPGNVRVWARTPTDEFDVEIKKELMKEPFTCYVEFSPISEEDEYRRQDSLIKLTSQGVVTRDWARRQMSNVDADAMAREEEKEILKQSPSYLQAKEQLMTMAIQEKMGELGLGQPPLATGGGEGEPQPVVGQEAGRGLVPPIPQRAPLGSGADLENKLAKLRKANTSGIQGQGAGGGGNR